MQHDSITGTMTGSAEALLLAQLNGLTVSANAANAAALSKSGNSRQKRGSGDGVLGPKPL